MKYIPTLLADYFAQGYNIKSLNADTYCWYYPLVYNDGTKRMQNVYLGEITERGKEYLYIRSHLADFTDSLNAMQLLREAELCSLSSICLKSYTRTEDGTSVEAIYVQSIFPAELAMQNKEVFIDVVHEVANRADAVEKKYLGIDK